MKKADRRVSHSTTGRDHTSAANDRRWLWFLMAISLFLLSSGLALLSVGQVWARLSSGRFQSADVYRWQDDFQRSGPGDLAWWTQPVVWNVSHLLPLVDGDLTAISCAVGTEDMWAVGQGGLVLHSSNGGRSWERQYLTRSDNANRTELAAGPFFGMEAETGREAETSGGPAGAIVDSDALTRSDLYAVHFIDARRGWVAGDNLALFFTADGGSSWRQETVGRRGAMFHTLVFDGRDAVAASDDFRFAISRHVWIPAIYHFPKSLKSESPSRGPGELPRPTQAVLHEYRLTAFSPEMDLMLWSSIEDGTQYLRGSQGTLQITDHGRALVVAQDGSAWMLSDLAVVSLRRAVPWLRMRDRSLPDLNVPEMLSIESVADLAIAAGRRGAVYTLSGGTQWNQQVSGVQADLTGVAVTKSLQACAVGRDGTILYSRDRGRTWVRASRRREESLGIDGAPGILPPPLYFVSLLLVGLVIAPALRRPPGIAESTPSIAGVLVSDGPIAAFDRDFFDFTPVARGLSRFLRNDNTLPPLTLAITGEWGTGKSSLMNLLRVDLERYGFRPVWFNAWHHQKEDHLLASLLEAVRSVAIPPLLSPEGVSYRWRLLRIRWGRSLPLIVLLLAAFAISAGYVLRDPMRLGTVTRDLILFRDAASGKPQANAGEATTVLTFLTTLPGVLIALRKGVKGFTARPASLLAGGNRRVRLRDLEALTGFRQRFAAEFRDVTTALNPQTMTILIDDLDRCRPERVLEVLEAINFLVSSGDCFVVIGMALARVERCVGLGFKDVADALLDPAPEGAADGLSFEERARRRRNEFARQYLEKLINIVVPVPVPTADQSQTLLEKLNSRPPEPSQAAPATAIKMIRRALPIAGVAALILGSLWYGFYRLGLPSPPPKEDQAALREQQVAATASGAVASGPAGTASTGKSTGAPSTQTAAPRRPSGTQAATTRSPLPAEMPTRQGVGSFVPGRLPLAHSTPVVLLLVVVLIAAGAWRLSMRPQTEVHDSPDFTAALKTWQPLITGRRNTPRYVKRFVNRVRYLAMLQRREPDDLPLGEWIPRWWETVLRWIRIKRDWQQTSTQQEDPRLIPEGTLVALGALDYTHPEALRNGGIKAAALEVSDELATLLSDPAWSGSMRAHLRQYLEMSAGSHIL